jgi:hypothetical protein
LKQIEDVVKSFDAKLSQLMQAPASLDSRISSVGGPLPISSQFQQRGYQAMQDDAANAPFYGQNDLSKPMRGAVKRL